MYVVGGSFLDVVKLMVVGFLSGVKDGVIGCYVNMFVIGMVIKVLLLVVGDMVEIFVCIGDIKKLF